MRTEDTKAHKNKMDRKKEKKNEARKKSVAKGIDIPLLFFFFGKGGGGELGW
jgi:hypothetical protein